MPLTSTLNGSTLRALVARSTPTAFMPPPEPEAADRPRDRIWELVDTLHCSIVGTCLTNAEARTILAKLGRPDARTISEHQLHGELVRIAGRKDGGGRLLQRTLDRHHAREIERFAEARTPEAVRVLWEASLERGEIPSAYWAAITHPATTRGLVQDIFGEVHMLSHLVGQSNRADIRRLRQLEQDLNRRDAAIAIWDERIMTLMRERDELGQRARAIEAERPVQTPPNVELTCTRTLEARLAREGAHAEALEERLAVLSQATERLSIDLAAEIARRTAAENELATLESALEGAAQDDTGDPVRGWIEGRIFLYVGGRPRQVTHLRRFVDERGGRLLSHDGGIEESLALLPSLVGQADCAVFPVSCISHEASLLLKRHCEARAKPFRPVRSASLASFVHVLAQPG